MFFLKQPVVSAFLCVSPSEKPFRDVLLACSEEILLSLIAQRNRFVFDGDVSWFLRMEMELRPSSFLN